MANIIIFSFVLSFFLSLIFTKGVIKIAKRYNVVDKPGEARKIHTKPIPLLGGLAIFLSFFIVVFFTFVFFKDTLLLSNFSWRHLTGLLFAGVFLMLAGIQDDLFNLKPAQQLIGPVLASLSVIFFGIGVNEITNPFGGTFSLNFWEFSFLNDFKFIFIADIFTFLWLLGMMYTTKLLDGLDGLVTGVGAIGSIVIFLLTMTTKYYQPDTALLAVIFAGSCLGFLVFNFNPAKIFLGEGGSLFIGFILGVLAIISGGKIATALLIMGIPILDAAWVILRRIFEGNSPFKTSDRKHLHFRLLDSGLTQKQAVTFLYVLAAGFGISTLFLQSKSKIIALGILFLVMVAIAISVVSLYKKRNKVKQ